MMFKLIADAALLLDAAVEIRITNQNVWVIRIKAADRRRQHAATTIVAQQLARNRQRRIRIGCPGERRRDHVAIVLDLVAIGIFELRVALANHADQTIEQRLVFIDRPGQVDANLLAIETAIFDRCFMRSFSLRLLGNAIDQTASIALSVKRRNRTTQHFNGVQLVRIGTEEGVGIGELAQAVLIGTGRLRVETAHENPVIAFWIRTIGFNAYAGDITQHFRDALRILHLDLLAADNRY